MFAIIRVNRESHRSRDLGRSITRDPCPIAMHVEPVPPRQKWLRLDRGYGRSSTGLRIAGAALSLDSAAVAQTPLNLWT